MAIQAGLHSSTPYVVGERDTAAALGSGDLDVLATPRLLAWCEAATVAAVATALTGGQTTVGTRVQLEHSRPSAVGTALTVEAALTHVDGRLLRFDVAAQETAGPAVAHGQLTRVVVDRDRFLARLDRSDSA